MCNSRTSFQFLEPFSFRGEARFDKTSTNEWLRRFDAPGIWRVCPVASAAIAPVMEEPAAPVRLPLPASENVASLDSGLNEGIGGHASPSRTHHACADFLSTAPPRAGAPFAT